MPIVDLRSALAVYSENGHQVESISRSIDPHIELVEDYVKSSNLSSGSVYADDQPLYCYQKPTSGIMPVMLGVFGSRDRIRLALDPDKKYPCSCSNAEILNYAISNRIPPIYGAAITSRTVDLTKDIGSIIPTLIYTVTDPGPTITLGLVLAHDEDTGNTNVSVHRMTVKKDRLTVWIAPGRDLDRMITAKHAKGERLPVSINIGIDPGIYITACSTRPTVSYEDNELAFAGGLRGEALQLAKCKTNEGYFIDHAEVVIEGFLSEKREYESSDESGSVWSMPEYAGYRRAAGNASVLDISGVTYRDGACYQTVTGPGREQSELLGSAQELSTYRLVEDEGLNYLITDIYCKILSHLEGRGSQESATRRPGARAPPPAVC